MHVVNLGMAKGEAKAIKREKGGAQTNRLRSIALFPLVCVPPQLCQRALSTLHSAEGQRGCHSRGPAVH